MAKIDFPSGVQRLTYVLCIILMATLAGWMVASIVHLNPQGFEPLGLNPVINCLLRMLFAFIGVWGFSVMFNSPQRMCLVAATIGAITDTLRLEIVDLGVPAEARSNPSRSRLRRARIEKTKKRIANQRNNALFRRESRRYRRGRMGAAHLLR